MTGVTGGVGLLLLGSASSLHGGVARDGNKTTGVILPGFYLTYWLARPIRDYTVQEQEHEVGIYKFSSLQMGRSLEIMRLQQIQ